MLITTKTKNNRVKSKKEILMHALMLKKLDFYSNLEAKMWTIK